MKNILLTATMALAIGSAQAQDYKPVLERTFLAFDTTQDQTIKLEQSNKLALIAKKWPDQWVTHYYVAYSKAQLAYNFQIDAAKRDAYLDEAQKERDEAVALLKKQDDETHVLDAMIAHARMAVDGMNRWQKYGKIFSDELQAAKEINPDNPRMYYLRGLSTFFTPKQFGGGKKAALPYFEKAEGLFPKDAGKDISQPHWGKDATSYFLGECKKDDKE